VENNGPVLKRNKTNPEAGSKVAIAASAYQPIIFKGESAAERQNAISSFQNKLRQSIRSRGFSAHLPEDTINPPIDGLEWANTAEERARHLINHLNNPEIEAIAQVNGGGSTIEVVNLLEQYDRNWQQVAHHIENAWKARHPNQPLPAHFWQPRLSAEHYQTRDGKTHGLPRRGIPHIGYSDISVLNNFLGQRGIARPYYANMLIHKDHELEAWAEYLTNPQSQTSYQGLIAANNIPLSNEPMSIYATVPEWINGTRDTAFQFQLETPTILALETIDSPEQLGRLLIQAEKSGMLKNVKAIVVGGLERGQPLTLEQAKKSKVFSHFLNQTNIPVMLSQEDHFGHGRGAIRKPFANFADAQLLRGQDGTFSLTVSGHASKEKLAHYRVAPESRIHSTTSPQSTSPISDFPGQFSKPIHQISGKESLLEKEEMIALDWRSLNETLKQDIAGKVCVISTGREPHIHSALISGRLSGKFDQAKAIVVAIPEAKEGEGPNGRTAALRRSIEDACAKYYPDKPVYIIQDNTLSQLKGRAQGNLSIGMNGQQKVVTLTGKGLSQQQDSQQIESIDPKELQRKKRYQNASQILKAVAAGGLIAAAFTGFAIPTLLVAAAGFGGHLLMDKKTKAIETKLSTPTQINSAVGKRNEHQKKRFNEKAPTPSQTNYRNDHTKRYLESKAEAKMERNF
jgi:muramoyltetrapeptide carboxypeptidase LdcA involved in peptidoglycan recycling